MTSPVRLAEGMGRVPFKQHANSDSTVRSSVIFTCSLMLDAFSELPQILNRMRI